ncbi:DUF1626 domain-containing protein [Thiorhodovibrio frisius]|uniref:Uncharacterized protein n=1 Tax=Thiorhodovibrio frisius TaxID=631362 RepID=H8Z6T0_9GAMM|nr:DUF1626 domain-containing protein [Thiorhodovibrio frisius]EIC20796.1 Protein of unknown function (DUF1626) [Thiorhodovibrio frisius]WPL21847.1 hypothetical protein Thiofri_01983 [Thiorhodovibrio frisius]
MTTLESIKETVNRELPAWLETDPAFREAILGLTANLYSRREETNDWFHQTLDEMRRERERQDALWRRFYERHHQRQANRLIVISPMIDSRAQDVARHLGIETFGEPEEVSS